MIASLINIIKLLMRPRLSLAQQSEAIIAKHQTGPRSGARNTIQSEEFSKYIPRGRDGDAIYKITATQNDSEMFSGAGVPYPLKIPTADTNEENRARADGNYVARARFTGVFRLTSAVINFERLAKSRSLELNGNIPAKIALSALH